MTPDSALATVESLAALIGIQRGTAYRPDAAACRSLAQEVLWRSNQHPWAVVSFVRGRLNDHYAFMERMGARVTTISPRSGDNWLPSGDGFHESDR